MKKYKVTGRSGAPYTVTLDASGIIDVDGLLPATATALKDSVGRNMTTHGLSVLPALSRAIGSYSTAVEVDAETTVSDLV